MDIKTVKTAADSLADKVVVLRKALAEAPTATQVLARPHDYEAWYNGARKEALNE